MSRNRNNKVDSAEPYANLSKSNRFSRAITDWRRASGINTGPLLRGLKRTGLPRDTPLSYTAAATIITNAIDRAGGDPTGYSTHSLRAGFITWAALLGSSDRAIAAQTNHRSLASIGPYVRVQNAWTMNAATDVIT